jgi:hypothetical protein
VNPNDLPFPASWVREPQKLSGEAGMHRFVWDLRYSPAKGGRASFRRPSGVLALPGNYTVQLTAHGKNTTQPLTIKLDSRVKTTHEELTRQFELASKLSAREGEVSLALQQVAELRRQIEARRKEAGARSDAVKALEELNQKLEAMVPPEGEGGFGLFGLALPAKGPETLPKVASALNGLMTIVESADAAPTEDAETASAKWDKAAQETLAQWADFQNKELTNTNALLEKANLKPVATTETSGVH